MSYYALHPDAVHLRLKVVPGACRSRVVGLYGDRLKILISAPPEDGKANAAVCALIAQWLGIPLRHVELIEGQRSPQKTLRIPAGTQVPQV